ncbi:hypothetical protein K438DRAFT_1767385 [Mycena galopus ATCC 62051]|nr:hypothetical protein K438DRAFT_1767385 [Mycena galopus ATCC 62051]
MHAIRAAFKADKHVQFHGTCQILEDPLVTDQERVKKTIYEIWKITGYRFRKRGTKPDFGVARTKPAKRRPGPARARAPSRAIHWGWIATTARAACALQAFPGMLQEKKSSGFTSNTMMRTYSRRDCPQMHSAWTDMSEILWKRDKAQLPSAEVLLKEFGDGVDILDIHPPEGVEQLCWAMKKIIEPLKGKIVEIAVGATFMTEHDNAGFPLSYSLLSTTGSDDVGKRERTLEALVQKLRDKYGVKRPVSKR